MQSSHAARSTRKQVKYYSTDDEENCVDTSDSNFTPSKECPASKLKKNTSKRLERLKGNTQEDSPSSQDSLTTLLRRPKKRKNSIEVPHKSKKPKQIPTSIPASGKEDCDGSDSSFVFTDEISEASFSRKENPESLTKRVLTRTKSRASKKDETKPKRKDLSASRKAVKKLKAENKLPRGIDPNSNTLVKSSMVEGNSNDTDDLPSQLNVEPFSYQESVTTYDDIPLQTSQSLDNLAIKIKPDPDAPQKPSNTCITTKRSSKETRSNFNKVKFEPLECTEMLNDVFVKSESESKPLLKSIKVKKEPDLIKREKRQTKKIKNEPPENFNIKSENEFEDIKTKITTIENENITIKTEDPRRWKIGSGIEWEATMLGEVMDLDFWLSKSIINLFKNDCTIPFIARYRREYTRNMDADQLRHVKDAYEYVKSLESKAQTILKQIQKAGKLNKSLENSILYAKSIEELDYIYAPYKQGSSKSKAEKARALGLEEAALNVLNGTSQFRPSECINASIPGLKTNDEVIQGVQNIMADIFSKDEGLLEYIHQVENRVRITVKSSKMKNTTDKKKGSNAEDNDATGKYKLYYDFRKDARELLPHQVLALNRGEQQKVLSVKMQVEESFQNILYEFCSKKWLKTGCSYPLRTQMFRASFNDSYTRLISPLLIRRVRSKLNRTAQQAAIENFALNLKSLLQTPPVKGCPILGIDPGIRHGVKFALISSNGDVLWTAVLNFDMEDPNSYINQQHMETIKQKMVVHRCELIGLGNGKGCRTIEGIISDYIANKFFTPELNVEYTIVNERGASIYSCTSIAKEEFPNLDPNLISAVFIARSLQEPLSEFVKVEPKHLGVGTYQHDMPEKQLNETLDEIVMECVSFVGVDINTASVHLLKRVAGLGGVKATNIIEWRRKKGPFKNREQLNLVKGIGPKTFEQCSGFIRIHPQTCNAKIEKCKSDGTTPKKKNIACNDSINLLDSTMIHPESYANTYLFIDYCGADLADLGTQKFIDRIKSTVDGKGINTVARDLNQPESLISLIYDALIKPKDYDYRSQFSKPVFKKGLVSIESLKPGMRLQGRVSNVAQFGAFVDLGVGKDGLIHKSNMRGMKIQVGDRVEVDILTLEISRGRIGLLLYRTL